MNDRPNYSGMSAEDFDRTFLWHFRGRLFEERDGDTAETLPDCGFRIAGMPAIRLAGFSAPESWEPGGPEATRILTDALRRGEAAKWPLRLVTHQRETVVTEEKSFDRYIGDLYVIRDGRLVDVVELL